MSQDIGVGMQEEAIAGATSKGKTLKQGSTGGGIPTHRTLKPPNSIPKPLSRPASAKGAKPMSDSKENDSAPKASARVRPVGSRVPSSHPASSGSAGTKPRPAGVRAAPASASTRGGARKPLSAGRAPAPPTAAGDDDNSAARPLVKAGVGAARRGRPRPRGMATVGGAAPLFAAPGELHAAIVKAARRTGQLNLSSRDLAEGEMAH